MSRHTAFAHHQLPTEHVWGPAHEYAWFPGNLLNVFRLWHHGISTWHNPDFQFVSLKLVLQLMITAPQPKRQIKPLFSNQTLVWKLRIQLIWSTTPGASYTFSKCCKILFFFFQSKILFFKTGSRLDANHHYFIFGTAPYSAQGLFQACGQGSPLLVMFGVSEIQP